MSDQETSFEFRFSSGYFVRCEITEEQLMNSIDPQLALLRVMGILSRNARYGIYGYLEPTKNQADDYLDLVLRTPPWMRDSMSPPWENWLTRPLPEPVFTNVQPTGRGIVITKVFGGVLKPRYDPMPPRTSSF